MEPNINFVTDQIAIGGDLDTDRPQVAEQQLAALVALGITHIIDCREEWSDEDFVAEHAPQIAYLHNGTHDDGHSQPDEFFDRGLSFGREALADDGAKLLVHCHMGINRGPSLGYAVMLDQGHDPVEALDAIRAARPRAGISYSEDALWHHLKRSEASAEAIQRELERIRAWRGEYRIDPIRMLRLIGGGHPAA